MHRQRTSVRGNFSTNPSCRGNDKDRVFMVSTVAGGSVCGESSVSGVLVCSVLLGFQEMKR